MSFFIFSSSADPPVWTQPQSDISVWIITTTDVFVKFILFPKSFVHGFVCEEQLPGQFCCFHIKSKGAVDWNFILFQD